ncbi:MAG: hypothetical protein ABW185_09755 [Sedimenticola sp.]
MSTREKVEKSRTLSSKKSHLTDRCTGLYTCRKNSRSTQWCLRIGEKVRLIGEDFGEWPIRGGSI